MDTFLLALIAELRKNRNSRITWITFVSFGLAPVMGGVFSIIVRNPTIMSKVVALRAKAEILNFSPDWNSYLSLLTLTVGVGGILLFGFVASWIFGREFSEGTSKDLLALPISRKKIVDAKFTLYFFWCFALSFSNVVLASIIGSSLSLDGWNDVDFVTMGQTYAITTLLSTLIGVPVALFAMIGQGYLAPLGFVALSLVFAQIIAATGFGAYFPWSIPGLYSGAAGEYRSQLDWISYGLLIFVALTGYVSSFKWFQQADQTK
jgi:ABC-type transport system involved in multi-copper enzyme maturation permease subunit